MPKHDRICIDPNVMVGKPCIKGTRILVDLILRRLASGHSQEEVMEDYAIEKEDVLAALGFAIDEHGGKPSDIEFKQRC